jgi:hypothetical protein
MVMPLYVLVQQGERYFSPRFAREFGRNLSGHAQQSALAASARFSTNV